MSGLNKHPSQRLCALQPMPRSMAKHGLASSWRPLACLLTLSDSRRPAYAVAALRRPLMAAHAVSLQAEHKAERSTRSWPTQPTAHTGGRSPMAPNAGDAGQLRRCCQGPRHPPPDLEELELAPPCSMESVSGWAEATLSPTRGSTRARARLHGANAQHKSVTGQGTVPTAAPALGPAPAARQGMGSSDEGYRLLGVSGAPGRTLSDA